MKKMSIIVLASIAIITLLLQTGSIASVSVTHDSEEANFDPEPSAMSCASSPQAADATAIVGKNYNTSIFLSDEEFSNFKYESRIFELKPGQTDTISHRHDCDVFVTVMEGTLLIGQEFKKADTVRTGEIFHEHRNVIHSISINPSKDHPMKALVTSVRKDGRAFYTPLYPKK